jgi:nucleoside-diphosphate-sugar epimerase
MRIFVTGATGFIGAHVVADLLAHGHQVLGMTRSARGAAALAAAGAEVHHGQLEDLDSLRSGAAQADAVIHTAFDHDFSNFVANCEKDRRAIAALGAPLVGSDRPLLITSGVGLGGGRPGRAATEDVFDTSHPNPRIASELAGAELAASGVTVVAIRLPQVHDPVRQGLITPFVALSRQQGVVAYVGDGSNRWPAAHVADVARLYRLAVERGVPARYHAVAEEGIAMREIARVVAAGLGLPLRAIDADAAPAQFGWMAGFAAMDMPASSAWTRQTLGWQPTGPDLLSDLRQMDYTAPAA